jgi:hypothetical protein
LSNILQLIVNNDLLIKHGCPEYWLIVELSLVDKDFDNILLKKYQELYNLDFNDSDIWDAIDHGAFLFKYYKILKAYLKN